MQIKFVDTLPQANDIEEERLYISVKYNMTTHRCACGCGTIVPLPISPTDWSLAYDGEHVSLNPSVGNGALSCRSHYYIHDSQIVWLPKMSALPTSNQKLLDESGLENQQQGNRRPENNNLIKKLVSFFRDFIRR